MSINSKPRTETQKFTSDIAWVAISQLLTMALGIITLPALTKNYSSELYGVWSQVIVTVGLLTPILVLHLSTAVVRFLAVEEDKEKRRQAFGAMLWPVISFAGVFIILSLLFRQSLSTFLFADASVALFVPLTVIWASFSALSAFSLSYLRARGRIKRISVINFGLAFNKMLLVVILAVSGLNLAWIVGSIIVIEAIFVLAVFFTIIRDIGFPLPRLTGLKKYLNYSLPLIPFGVLLWVINASDRYFITHLLNITQTGIYSASYTLGSLISLFYAPISFVLFPRLTSLWENREFERVSNYLSYSTKLFLLLAIPGAAGLFILSQPLLKVLTTTEYTVGGELVLLVTLGIIFFGIYQINVFIIHLIQRTKWLAPMTLGAAIVNAGINIVLIPQIGIIGAAVSTIVSYFILAAIVTIWASRCIRCKLDLVFIIKVILATVIMALLLSFLSVNSILDIGLSVILGGTIYLVCLILMKAFKRQDILLLRETITNFNSITKRKVF